MAGAAWPTAFLVVRNRLQSNRPRDGDLDDERVVHCGCCECVDGRVATEEEVLGDVWVLCEDEGKGGCVRPAWRLLTSQEGGVSL